MSHNHKMHITNITKYLPTDVLKYFMFIRRATVIDIAGLILRKPTCCPV